MSLMNTSSLINVLPAIQRETTRYLYSLYLIFGISGCCLNILLFSQRQFRTVSCCTYFLASSLAMIINLGLGIGSTMYTLDHVDPNTSIVAFCKLRIYLNQVVALIYRWSLTAACVDRYALSSSNVRFRNFARVYIARRVVAILIIIWIILPVHTLVLYNIRTGVCGIFYTIAGSLYHSIFTTAMSCVFPSSIMFICAFLIRRNLALKRQRQQPIVYIQKERKDEFEYAYRARDQQVLIMLLTQVIVYVISVIPLMIFYIYNAATLTITDKSIDRITIERFSGFVAEVMVFIFPVLSFYLYTMSSDTFRKELIKLLRSLFRCTSLINNQRIQPIIDNTRITATIEHPLAIIQPLQSNINHQNMMQSTIKQFH